MDQISPPPLLAAIVLIDQNIELGNGTLLVLRMALADKFRLQRFEGLVVIWSGLNQR